MVSQWSMNCGYWLLHRYAQIEKLLASDHFENWIDVVQVETDHQATELFVLKPLNSAPKRLQGMLLRLQNYSLHVNTRVMVLLADTLGCVYILPWNLHMWTLEGVDHTIYLPSLMTIHDGSGTCDTHWPGHNVLPQKAHGVEGIHFKVWHLYD